ncbi:MAG: bifunctional DNA primase/polymerase [Terracidiphilus sp.]|jgi:hypothetical protein
MISAEEFLKKFKEGQATVKVQHELSPNDLSDFQLDSALTSALERGWYLAPVLTRSRYFLRRALAGEPSQDLVEISRWAREYSECGCNWAVETGARSGLLILEFTYDVGGETVRRLGEDDWSWRTTLQFTDQNARFVCFRYSGQRIRAIRSEFLGARTHLDDCLLIPPSVMPKGSQLTYLNPGAKVLGLPNWLLGKPESSGEALIPSESDGADYIAA